MQGLRPRSGHLRRYSPSDLFRGVCLGECCEAQLRPSDAGEYSAGCGVGRRRGRRHVNGLVMDAPASGTIAWENRVFRKFPLWRKRRWQIT
jgi:hypothetical protein